MDEALNSSFSKSDQRVHGFVRRGRRQVFASRPNVGLAGTSTSNVATQTKPQLAGKLQKKTLAAWCAITLAVIYFLRTTIFPIYAHVPGAVWVGLGSLSIVVVAGFAVAAGGKWRGVWCGVIAIFGLGVCVAELLSPTFQRFIMLSLLMIAVGPVVVNPVAMQMRAAAWRLVEKGLPGLLIVSAAWYLFHLPCPFGRSPFAGFMTQSMLLGPFTGIGVIIAVVRALHGNLWRWGVLALIGVLPLLAAGSRIAILAAGGAGCFLVLRRKPVLGSVLLLLFVATIWSFVTSGKQEQTPPPPPGSVMSGLARKGIQNDRGLLWQARFNECKSSPLVGVGIGMGEGEGVARDSKGNIQIEPGSSYLAVLSMTGSLGAITFWLGIGTLTYGFAKSRRKAPVEKDILAAVGIFFAVHGVAEGWILSFGSPIGAFFWI